MLSTVQPGPAAVKSHSGKFTTFLIAIAMLSLGFVLGSQDWRLANGTSTTAAPAGSVIYDDWRGNSAGMRKDHRTGR
jgi:hypothetical protein